MFLPRQHIIPRAIAIRDLSCSSEVCQRVQLGLRDCGSSWGLCLNVLVLTVSGKLCYICTLSYTYRAGRVVIPQHSSSLTSTGHKDLVVMTNSVVTVK